MKRIIVFCFVLVFPALALVGFWTSKTDHPTDKVVFEKIKVEELHNPNVAMDLKNACASIGHRLTGSENGKKAEQYAFDLFKHHGFKDVAFQEFEVNAWKRESVALTLYYGGKDTTVAAALNSFPVKLSPSNAGCVTSPEVVSLASTPVQADVFESVVDVGNGLKADFDRMKDNVRGKIVLLNLSISPKDSTLKNLHRSEKAALAIASFTNGYCLCQ
jgi:carboxypeptidase Q